MQLQWAPTAWDDYVYWQQTDMKVVARINDLLRDAMRHPFEGIGKPEPLKGQLRGYWSRRISQEHRLVYTVRGTGAEIVLAVAQCRYHY